MSDRDYPLRAARELKERAVDDASQGLGRAMEACRQAQAELDACDAALSTHGEATRRWEATEASRGAASVATFQRIQAYRERRALEARALSERCDAARAKLDACLAEEARAREALATARAEAEAVERHETRWREAKRREAQMREELEAEDVAQARRHHED